MRTRHLDDHTLLDMHCQDRQVTLVLADPHGTYRHDLRAGDALTTTRYGRWLVKHVRAAFQRTVEVIAEILPDDPHTPDRTLC